AHASASSHRLPGLAAFRLNTPAACSVSAPVSAHDRDRRHVLVRKAAQVVGQTIARVVELTGSGTAEDLAVHLVQHAQTRGADRVSEALQAAIDLTRDLTVGVVEAVQHVLP